MISGSLINNSGNTTALTFPDVLRLSGNVRRVPGAKPDITKYLLYGGVVLAVLLLLKR